MPNLLRAGAAGNFLAPISALSENGFKTVLEIDTVRCSDLLANRFAKMVNHPDGNLQYSESDAFTFESV